MIEMSDFTHFFSISVFSLDPDTASGGVPDCPPVTAGHAAFTRHSSVPGVQYLVVSIH